MENGYNRIINFPDCIEPEIHVVARPDDLLPELLGAGPRVVGVRVPSCAQFPLEDRPFCGRLSLFLWWLLGVRGLQGGAARVADQHADRGPRVAEGAGSGSNNPAGVDVVRHVPRGFLEGFDVGDHIDGRLDLIRGGSVQLKLHCR